MWGLGVWGPPALRSCVQGSTTGTRSTHCHAGLPSQSWVRVSSGKWQAGPVGSTGILTSKYPPSPPAPTAPGERQTPNFRASQTLEFAAMKALEHCPATSKPALRALLHPSCKGLGHTCSPISPPGSCASPLRGLGSRCWILVPRTAVPTFLPQPQP